MPMSDGITKLKKIEFKVGSKSFKFAINPENYTHAKPHRTTAVKTKSRIVVEDFQSDIQTITISGTTGFNPTGRKADRGIKKIKEMKNFLESYEDMGGNGSTPAEDFYFYNYTNDESYIVHLSSEGVTFSQDVNQPLLHRYEIKFVVLRKASEPAEDDIVDPEIGNKTPSIGGSYNPVINNNGITMPNVVVPNNGVQMPSVVTPNTSGSTPTYNTPSGNDIYNQGTDGYYQQQPNAPINPQAPSKPAYEFGMTGLGYQIGYYGGRIIN